MTNDQAPMTNDESAIALWSLRFGHWSFSFPILLRCRARTPMPPKHHSHAKRSECIRNRRRPNIRFVARPFIDGHEAHRSRNREEDQKQHTKAQYERMIHLAQPRLRLQPTLPARMVL